MNKLSTDASSADFPPRPLSYGEQLWCRLSEAASNNGLFAVFLQGKVDPDRLERALAWAMQAYPLLRASVGSHANRPSFIFRSQAPVPLHRVARQSEEHWREIAETEVDDSIRPNSPLLWRATLVSGEQYSELLVTVNHAITDGFSIQLMMDGVLRCYAMDENIIPPMAPAPSYEAYVSNPGLLRLMIRAVPELIRQLFSPQGNVTRTPRNSRAPAGQRCRTGFVIRAVDEVTSRRLLKASKANEETLNSLLSSLFLMATRDVIGDLAEPTTLLMSSAANVRPKLKGDFAKEVGYYATGFESRYTLAPDAGVWQLARQVSNTVKRKFTSDNIALGIFLKRFVLLYKKHPQDLLAAIARFNKTNIHLTNLGRLFMQSDYGNLKVQRLLALPSVQFMRKPVICLETHTFNGCLQLTFSYPTPVTDPAFIQQLINRFDRLLHEVASGRETQPRAQEQEGKHHVAAKL